MTSEFQKIGDLYIDAVFDKKQSVIRTGDNKGMVPVYGAGLYFLMMVLYAGKPLARVTTTSVQFAPENDTLDDLVI